MPDYQYHVKHFINNEYVDGLAGRTFETLNPATNQPIGIVAEGLAEDIDRAVKAARKAFDEGPWPRMRAEERSRILRRIADGIERYQGEIAAREVADTGVPISQISKGAIPRAAYNFTYFAEMTHRLTGESFPVEGEFLNYTVRRPVGVAGLITP